MSNIISNHEYEKALSDINNKLIMEKACSRFRQSIDEDGLLECRLVALWESMKNWQPTRGKRFTSFLYQKTVWECLKVINKKKKEKINHIITDVPDRQKTNVDEIIEVLPENLGDILVKRYIHGMTLREISLDYQCCHETIRRKIFRAIKILRKR